MSGVGSGEPRAGESDLRVLLGSLQPALDESEYVFVTHVDPFALSPELDVVVTVREHEGTTSVVRSGQLDDALAAGAVCGDPTPMARITLTVHSALAAVGLTAAVATALADHHISCNVVAGYFHDHLFVPASAADDALAALAQLSRGN